MHWFDIQKSFGLMRLLHYTSRNKLIVLFLLMISIFCSSFLFQYVQNMNTRTKKSTYKTILTREFNSFSFGGWIFFTSVRLEVLRETQLRTILAPKSFDWHAAAAAKPTTAATSTTWKRCALACLRVWSALDQSFSKSKPATSARASNTGNSWCKLMRVSSLVVKTWNKDRSIFGKQLIVCTMFYLSREGLRKREIHVFWFHFFVVWFSTTSNEIYPLRLLFILDKIWPFSTLVCGFSVDV